MKDPGGDSNYPASLSCAQGVIVSGAIGYEIVFEDLDTEGTGDLVLISDIYGNALTFSGTTLPRPFIVSGQYFVVRFQANSNGTTGRGFRLRWRVLTGDASPTTTGTAFGNSLQFDTQKGALLSGYLMTGALQRSGVFSNSFGYKNTASGNYSTALGYQTTASGLYSMAQGYVSIASGDHSIALGRSVTASGNNSTAMGTGVSSGNKAGVFVIGDSDPLGQDVTGVGLTDQFVARFLNGFYLMTCGNSNPGTGFGAVRTGVQIGRGQNSWASISDSTKKERFRPINQTELLHKIGAMPLTTWNYKGQHSIRHYGPMAQDFYAAFGHDGLGQVGCDTLIYSHDFAGITFAGVQALIKENEQLKAKLVQIEAQTNARLNETNARIEALEALLAPRRRGNLAARK